MRQGLLILGLWCGLASPAPAQIEELTPVDEEPETAAPAGQAPSEKTGPTGQETGPVILEEFAVDERNVVISAAKTRTTIQEAPGIITVITADEIRQRGHRTINDVLRTVPGFEGDRFDGNGWYDEAVARGQPRTLLILVNGVNVTDPLRNSLTLDYKIPIDAVKRIEVTSGPGGVIWGSNALLGVVNIILKDHQDLDGLYFIVGGGHGPGAQEAVKGFAAYGDDLLDGRLKLYTSLGFYSDRGAQLEVDGTKVLGVLPAPEPEGKTLFEVRDDQTDYNNRDWWLSHTLNLTLWDQLTLDWLIEFERDYRQIATGGALLRGTEAVRDENDMVIDEREVTRQTLGNDSMRTAGLTWRDRFFEDAFGLSTKVFAVQWVLWEDPFWVFPPRSDIAGLDKGVAIDIQTNSVWRYGFNIDADVTLPGQNHVIFGVEAFQDLIEGATRSDQVRRSTVLIPELADPMAADTLGQRGIFNRTRCPEPGTYDVQFADGETERVRFSDDCVFEESLFRDTTRAVGAFYVSDEWKASRDVAIQPGFRLQFSDAYDPVGLVSAALVWNIYEKVFLKLNYAEGFRPPEFQAVALNERALSGVGYKPDASLDVEQSQATEAEVNAVLFENAGWLRKMYVRGDYAYSVLSDLVRNEGGRFVNAGEREIHSVEMLARADLTGEHEIWLGGHYVRTEDSVLGPIRSFANVILMGGGKLQIIKRHLALTTLFTWTGPQEDLNRSPGAGTPAAPDSPLVVIDASDVNVDRIEPYLLLRAGVMVTNLWEDRLDIDAFVYNALDERYEDPDFFFDDRVQIRPQARGGWSALGQARLRF